MLVQTENEMDEDLKIVTGFPYEEMVRLGWITETEDMHQRVIALRKFFEVIRLTLLKEPLIPHIACHMRKSDGKEDYAFMTWIQMAKLQTRGTAMKALNLHKLENSIPDIKKLTKALSEASSEGLVQLLKDCGIGLTFLPYPGVSAVHGAVFVNQNRVTLVMNPDECSGADFGFSLLHEIAHVFYGHIRKDEISDADERQADMFAQKVLNQRDVMV